MCELYVTEWEIITKYTMEKTGDGFAQVLWLQVFIDWSIWEHLEINSYKSLCQCIFSPFSKHPIIYYFDN